MTETLLRLRAIVVMVIPLYSLWNVGSGMKISESSLRFIPTSTPKRSVVLQKSACFSSTNHPRPREFRVVDAQCTMYSQEIVMGKVKGKGGLQVC